MKTCPICEKGKLTKKTAPYEVYGVSLGRFPAEVCNQCGEIWFSEETSKEIEEIEKKKGLFGLSKQSKISYSGNSLIIRVPKEIVKFMDLKKETQISMHPESKNKLCIEI